MASWRVSGCDVQVTYLDHTPASPQPITQESHQQLPQDNAHHLKVVCRLSPYFAALSKPAAQQQHSKLFAQCCRDNMNTTHQHNVRPSATLCTLRIHAMSPTSNTVSTWSAMLPHCTSTSVLLQTCCIEASDRHACDTLLQVCRLQVLKYMTLFQKAPVSIQAAAYSFQQGL